MPIKEKTEGKNKKTANRNAWDLSPLFTSENDPRIEETQTATKKASYDFINKWKRRSDYLKDPTVLKEALMEYENWLKNFGANSKVYYYFHLRTELELNNPELRALFNKAKEITTQIQNDIQFFTLKLTKITETNQKKFLQDKQLAYFHHFLEKIFAEGKYVLSDAEEKIINLYSDTSYANWLQLVSGLISREEYDGYNFPRLLATLNSTDKKTRDWAGKAVSKILAKLAPVAEAEINSVLGYKKISDELRHTKRPDELRHLADDIPTTVVDTMINTVTQNFSLAHRYYAFKVKTLGQKKIGYHEKMVPFSTGKETEKKYSFEESKTLLAKLLNRLDPEFNEIFQKFLENGQIDVYPKTNRSDGAFCAGMRIADPTYILLNHTDQLKDVLTLAHEVGHGINNELIKKTQTEIYYGTPTSTAEVASTFIEDFVLEEIGRQTDKKTKLKLMMAKLDDDMATIFRQTAAYRFERDLHERFRQEGYLAKEEIGKMFLSHMKSYTGPAMEYSAGTENWWIYWSHFRNYFYVYSYSSGLLISKALQKMVRAEPIKIKQVKKFLTAGTSESPLKIFRRLGLSIDEKEIWQNGLTEIEELLNQTEKLYNEINKV